MLDTLPEPAETSADLFDPSLVLVASLRKGAQPIPAGYSPVYIGRSVGNWPSSPLGNPYSVKTHGRAGSIVRYRAWLAEQIAVDTPQRRELETLKARLAAGERLVLLCWCAPLPCHGHVLAEILTAGREDAP